MVRRRSPTKADARQRLGENELARQSGVTQPTIHRILTGESKSPRHTNLDKLAKALGTSSSFLSYGSSGENEPMQTKADYNVSSVAHLQSRQQYVYPIINWVQAGQWTEAVNPYEPGCEQEVVATDYQAKGYAFWLEVRGDSMTSPAGLSVPEGMMILVDPEEEALNGSLVVAQLEGSDEATFKRLVIDGGQKFLKPLNPGYPLIPINGNCRLIGVAVEMKMSLRPRTH
ncbi:LexA family protein [Modicisalibacter luteus]|uniref:LexA family protein n=1 Tax=Modicisalibacter luteus TaxID=453962 RepID=UPI0036459FA7